KPPVYFRSKLTPPIEKAPLTLSDYVLTTEVAAIHEVGDLYDGIDWESETTLFVLDAGTPRMYQHPPSTGPMSPLLMQITLLRPVRTDIFLSRHMSLQYGEWYLPLSKELIRLPHMTD